MLPYILVIIYTFIISACYYLTKAFKGKKLIFCILLFLPLLILCSFKNISVGNDSSGYYDYYKLYGTKPIGFTINDIENGFSYFASIFAHMKMPFTLFLLVCYLIVFTPFVLFSYRYSKHPEIVMLSTFLFQFYNFAVSGLRQSIAIGICMLGLYILVTNWDKRALLWKIVKAVISILFVLLASTLHRSAFIFAVPLVIFVVYDFININILFFLSACLLFAFISPYIYGMVFALIRKQYHYDPPASGFFLDIGFSTYIMIIFVVAFVILLKNNRTKRIDDFVNKTSNKIKLSKFDRFGPTVEANYIIVDENNFVSYFVLVVAANALLTCMLNSAEVFTRILIYLNIFFGLSLSNFIDLFKSKKTHILLKAGIAIVLFVFFYFASYKSGYLNIFPYRFGFYL